MIKPTKKGLLLTHAVLASTLFVTPLVHANTVIPADQNTTQVTNGTNNNTLELPFQFKIDTTGKAQDAVQINSIVGTNGGNFIIDPANVNGVNAVVPDTLFVGVHFMPAVLPGGTLTIGAGSGVTGSGVGSDAIFVENTATVINNAGTAQGTLSAVHYSKNGTNGTLNNTGTLQNFAGATKATILTDALGGGLTLNNTGAITQSVVALDAIQLNSNFTSITNNATGSILQTGVAGTGEAISIDAGVTTGNIINNGGVIALTDPASTGFAVLFDNGGVVGSTLSLTNQNGGFIGAQLADAVVVNGNIASINNTGLSTIQSAALAGGGGANAVIEIVAPFTISEGLNNSGFITNLAPAVLGTFAIDLSLGNATFNQSGGVVTGDVALASKDSTAVTGKVLNMTGGTISGDVIAANIVPNTLNLNGGAITGQTKLGGQGDTLNLGWDNVNEVVPATGGTNANLILGGAGNDIFNIGGGSFNNLTGGGGAGDTVNFNSSFTQNGTINDVDTINVGNGFPNVVLTSNGNITNLTGPLNVNAGGTMIANANITMGANGSVVVDAAAGGLPRGMFIANLNPIIDFTAAGGTQFLNQGVTQIGPTGTLTLIDQPAGTPDLFTNDDNAFFIPQIGGIVVPGGAVTNGQLIVNSVAAGAVDFTAVPNFVAPTFTGFVPNNSLFNVVVVNGGGTIDPLAANAPVFVPFSSAVVSYTASLINGNTIMQLKTSRNSYSSLVENEASEGVAGALDVLAQGNGPTNQTLLSLLGQLDGLATADEVGEAIESLAPPFNFGIPMGTRVGMNIMFEGVNDRINELHEWKVNSEPRRHRHRHRHHKHASNAQPVQVAQNGVSFGDPSGGAGIWGRVLGAHLDQDERDGAEGYKVNAAGGAIGADWGVNECFTLGLAASYTKVNVDDKDVNPKDASIKSWQGTAYGWFEFTHGLFLDAMVAYAGDDIKTNRVIGVNEILTAAQASFDGNHWGAQTDLGWRVVNDGSLYFAPFARLKWSHLDLDDYTETGAGDLNLTVANSDLDEFMGGLGFRLGSRWESGNICWIPELSAMIGYDFENDGEQSVAAFGGAPDIAFTTDGVKPGRTIFNLGLGLNANVSACSTFTIKYNLELRDDFVGNSGYLQYYYLWG